MSFPNFNSRSDGLRYDFSTNKLKYSSYLSLQNLVAKTPLPESWSVHSTPSEVSAIPCVLFGNPLRALFLKNRDFFCYGEMFVSNTRGPIGYLLGFWPSGPKPCGGNYNFLDCDWFKKLLFPTNSLAKLLSDSSTNQSHSKL